MEKRAHKRLAADFEVEIAADSIKNQICRVKDFCIGGMLITWQGRDVARNPNLTTLIRNDSLSITVKIPEGSGTPANTYILNAKAARIDGTSMGVSFIHPDASAIASIKHLAQISVQSSQSKPSAASSNSETPAQAHFNMEAKKLARLKYSETQERNILKQSLELIDDYIRKEIKTFFRTLEDKFQKSINQAKDNAEQNELFDAVNKFNKYQQGAADNIIKNALMPFKDYALKNKFDLSFLRKDSGTNKIGLIDKEDFEDWLVVKVMATKVETNNNDILIELQHRFTELSGLQQGIQNNPISPAVICNAFNDTMSRLPLELKLRKLIYATFEQEVAVKLTELYNKLNQQLAEAGILKEFDIVDHLGKIKHIDNRPKTGNKNHQNENISEDFSERANHSTSPSSRNSAGASNKGSASSTNLFTDSDQTFSSGQPNAQFSGFNQQAVGQATGNVTPKYQDTPSLQITGGVDQQTLKAQLHNPNLQSASARAFEVQNRIAENAANTVKQLIENHRKNSAQIFQFTPIQSSAPVIAAGDFSKKLNEMQLQEIEQSSSKLSERVYQNLKNEDGQDKQLGETETAALNVIERLFESILDLNQVDKHIHPWIKKLEIPFLKLLMQNPDFLQDINHPARKVLNSVAKLGKSGVANNDQNLNLINKSLQNIVEQFDQDISVFNSANHELESLLQRHEKIVKKNVDRVQEAAKGQFKVKHAKRFVDSTLESVLAGEEVPKALITLLDAGWRELLNLTALRFGTENDTWHEYEGVIHSLLDAANPKKEKPDLPVLLKSIKTGLNAVSPSGQFTDERTIAELRTLLTAKRDEDEVHAPKINVPIGAFNSEVLESTGTADDIWLRRARKLQIGDWLEVDGNASIFEQDDNEEQPDEQEETPPALKVQMRLAWVDEDGEEFVFVNHQGMKVVDVSVKQIARLLREGKAHKIDDQDQPIVNLGLDRMVHKFYEQLVHHASHDELTGLINRREFERQIKIALSESRSMGVEHTLACIDFNEIKQVNNSCGFEAGDELLVCIAQHIKANTPKNTIIARIAGERFAILLSNINQKSANILLDNLMRAFTKFSFEWNSQKFSISCAVGTSLINANSDSVSSLLQDVFKACELSKGSGNSKRELNEKSNNQSAVEQWEHRLNEAIEQNRLSLRCQKIHSLNDNSLPDQYEILISMTDENGKEIDTSDFIHAAECFEKMQLVDRWVIKNVLEWMQSSPDSVQKLNACGINLSSDSLNDEELLYFIFENMVHFDKVPRSKICFEVTESTAVKNVDDLADFVSEMQNIGCLFSLDDFGSESSSYGFLKNLSLNYVKIDGDFIRNLKDNDNDFAMVKSINEMVHFMGKKTIAKQVEDQQTIDKLKEIGVDFIQGYGVEAPKPLNSL